MLQTKIDKLDYKLRVKKTFKWKKVIYKILFTINSI